MLLGPVVGEDLGVARVRSLAAENDRGQAGPAEDLVEQAELDLTVTLAPQFGTEMCRPQPPRPHGLLQRGDQLLAHRVRHVEHVGNDELEGFDLPTDEIVGPIQIGLVGGISLEIPHDPGAPSSLTITDHDDRLNDPDHCTPARSRQSPEGVEPHMRPATGGGPPRYQEIMRAISDDISSGRVAVGARLPTEQQLCTQHGVGRHTIREAIRGLVDAGMLERRPRLGTTVISAEPIVGYRWIPGSIDDIADNMDATLDRSPSGPEHRGRRGHGTSSRLPRRRTVVPICRTAHAARPQCPRPGVLQRAVRTQYRRGPAGHRHRRRLTVGCVAAEGRTGDPGRPAQ